MSSSSSSDTSPFHLSVTSHLLRFLPTLVLDHLTRMNILEEGALDRTSARRVFDTVDADGSGSISVSELMRASVMLGLNLTRARLAEVLAEVDTDQSGQLEFDEFVEVLNFAKAPEAISAETSLLVKVADHWSRVASPGAGRWGAGKGGRSPTIGRRGLISSSRGSTPVIGRRLIGASPALYRRTSADSHDPVLGTMMRKAMQTLQANESETRQRITAAFAVVELSGLHELTENLPAIEAVDAHSPRRPSAHQQVREQARTMLSSAARRLLRAAEAAGGDIVRFTAEGMLIMWTYDASIPGAARLAAIAACRCMLTLRDMDQSLLHSTEHLDGGASAAAKEALRLSSLKATAAAARVAGEGSGALRLASRRRPHASDRRMQALRRAAFEAGSFDAMHLGSITSLDLDRNDNLVEMVDAPMTSLEIERDPWALGPVAEDTNGSRKVASLGMARLGVAGGVGVGALYGVRLGEPEDHETIGAPFTQVLWGDPLDELTLTVQMQASAGDVVIAQDVLALAADALVLSNVPPSVTYDQTGFEAPTSLLLLQAIHDGIDGLSPQVSFEARASAHVAALEDQTCGRHGRTAPDALLHWLADPEQERVNTALMKARATHWEIERGSPSPNDLVATAAPGVVSHTTTVARGGLPEGMPFALSYAIGVEGLRMRESTVVVFRMKLRLQSLESLLRAQQAVRKLARTVREYGMTMHTIYQPSHRQRRAVAAAVAVQVALRQDGIEVLCGVSSGTVAVGVAGLTEEEEERFSAEVVPVKGRPGSRGELFSLSRPTTPSLASAPNDGSSVASSAHAVTSSQPGSRLDMDPDLGSSPGVAVNLEPSVSRASSDVGRLGKGGSAAPEKPAYRLSCLIAGRPVERALMLANSARRGGPTLLVGRVTAQGALSHHPLSKMTAIQRRGGSGAWGLRFFRSCIVYRLDEPSADDAPTSLGVSLRSYNVVQSPRPRGRRGSAKSLPSSATTSARCTAGSSSVLSEVGVCTTPSNMSRHQSDANCRMASPRLMGVDVAKWLKAHGHATSTTNVSHLSASRRRELREAFEVFDRRKTGMVELSSLLDILRGSGVFRDEAEIFMLLNHMLPRCSRKPPRGSIVSVGSSTSALGSGMPHTFDSIFLESPRTIRNESSRAGCSVKWADFIGALEHFTENQPNRGAQRGQSSGSLGETAALVFITHATRRKIVDMMGTAGGSKMAVAYTPQTAHEDTTNVTQSTPWRLDSALSRQGNKALFRQDASAISMGAPTSLVARDPTAGHKNTGRSTDYRQPAVRNDALLRQGTKSALDDAVSPTTLGRGFNRSAFGYRPYSDPLDSAALSVAANGLSSQHQRKQNSRELRFTEDNEEDKSVTAPCHSPSFSSLFSMMSEVSGKLQEVERWRAARALDVQRRPLSARKTSRGAHSRRPGAAERCPPTPQVVPGITHPSRTLLLRKMEDSAAQISGSAIAQVFSSSAPCRLASPTAPPLSPCSLASPKFPASLRASEPSSPRTARGNSPRSRSSGWSRPPPTSASSPRGRHAPPPTLPTRRPFSAQ